MTDTKTDDTERTIRDIYQDVTLEAVSAIARHSDLSPAEQAKLHKRVSETLAEELQDHFNSRGTETER